MNNIDYDLLQEQLDFLLMLATDLELGNVILPTRYGELGALPTEYLDGVSNMIYDMLHEVAHPLFTPHIGSELRREINER
jgi:hypothetical protein